MQSASSAAVGIAGVALERSAGDPTRNLMELIFDTVRAALSDAGCTIGDIDAVVIAAHDLVDGRSLSSMVTAPAAGAYLLDEIRVTDDGLVALSLSAAMVQSAHAERTLVATWGRPSEADVEAASARSFDPFTEQPFGLSDQVVAALRASAYCRRFGSQSSQRQALAEQRRGRADRNPRAAPLVEDPHAPRPLLPGELSNLSDTVAAVVLGPPGPLASSAQQARLIGIGHGSESFPIAGRDPLAAPAACEAVQHALDDSGTTLGEMDVVELAGRSSLDEVMMAEAVGLATPGNGCADLLHRAEVSPSGGGAAGESPPATGLARFVEAILQLRGEAGGVQLEQPCQRALVVSGSVVAGQTQTAVVAEMP